MKGPGEMDAQARAAQSVEKDARLKNYTLAKQEVARLIRAAKQLLEGLGAKHEVEQCQALLVKLAEDRFNLAVVGQFKRGKSSLMNAVIGRDLLPTGVLPLTSVVTTLCYGPEERVLLKRQGWAFDEEVSLSELAKYVTEEGNPGNEQGVLEVRVMVPVAFLRRGLYFVDTPGVGSARRENTATTYAFLPEADAVIFVTSVEAPLSEVEQRFLGDIRRCVRKLFVAVNKMDLLAPGEPERVLGYIRDGVVRALGGDDVRFFPLSARQGLAARLHDDRAGMQASGLQEFEEGLGAFLGPEKEQTFLVAIFDRARQLLAVNSGSSVTDVREQIESLRVQLLSGEPATGGWLVRKAGSYDPHILEQSAAAGAADLPRGDERRAGNCQVCAALNHAVFKVFAKWQYMLATNEGARLAFASGRSFCHRHTWQFEQFASPHGISLGYAPLVESVGAALRQVLQEAPGQAAARVGALLPATDTCPACRVLREMEEDQVRRFLDQRGSAASEQAHAPSPGLCLPHLRAALVRAPSAERVAFLLREEVRRLEELSEDLHSYTLKRDALRRGLLNANEESAWRRALVELTGERAVLGPWSDEAGV